MLRLLDLTAAFLITLTFLESFAVYQFVKVWRRKGNFHARRR